MSDPPSIADCIAAGLDEAEAAEAASVGRRKLARHAESYRRKVREAEEELVRVRRISAALDRIVSR